MGIQDRDYYREQYRRTASMRADVRRFPPQSKTKLRTILFWLVIGFALFIVFDRWLSPALGTHRASSAVTRRDVVPSSGFAVQPPAPPEPYEAIAVVPSAPITTRPPGSVIYRCGNRYGASPCPNGRAVESPAASGFDTTPSSRLAALVAAGRTADEPAGSTSSSTTISNGVTTTVTQSSTGSECPGLAAQIAGIDADARQGHPLPYRDWLRATRQQVRDRQAALHC